MKATEKSGWRCGPWQDEPDKVQWQDEDTGFLCLVVRGPVGALCGYVSVPEGHPWHGIGYSEPLDGTDKNYDDPDWWRKPTPEKVTDVHGGLTYSGEGVRGAPEGHWWFGFDCAHAGDFAPAMHNLLSWERSMMEPNGDTYRDLAYVKAECTKLATQLAAVA